MAGFLLFDAAADLIADNGWPGEVWIGLSRNSVAGDNAYMAADTLAGILEVEGTGYARVLQPSPPGRRKQFDKSLFETLGYTDWPDDVRSCFAATSSDGSGLLLAAWDLEDDAAVHDMSLVANVQLRVAPVYEL